MKHTIGVIRYSVLAKANLGNWKSTRQRSVQDGARVLFADRRMAARAAMFEAVTAPCFKAQGPQPDFTLLVLVSPLMPEKWRDRLQAQLAEIPQAVTWEVAPDSSVGNEVRAFAATLPPSIERVLTFRIDDDDCLSNGMLERLAQHNVEDNLGKVISFPNGIYAALDGDGRLSLEHVRYLNIALGISYVSGREKFRSIFSLGAHQKLSETAEIVADQHPNAWLRSIHEASDSKTAKPNRNIAKIDEVLAAFPFLDVPKVEAAFAAVRGTGA